MNPTNKTFPKDSAFYGWTQALLDTARSTTYSPGDYADIRERLIKESSRIFPVLHKLYRGDLNGLSVEVICECLDRRERLQEVIQKTVKTHLLAEPEIKGWLENLHEVFSDTNKVEFARMLEDGYEIDVEPNLGEYRVLHKGQQVFMTKVPSIFFMYTQLGFNNQSELFALFFIGLVKDMEISPMVRNFVLYIYITSRQQHRAVA